MLQGAESPRINKQIGTSKETRLNAEVFLYTHTNDLLEAPREKYAFEFESTAHN